MASHFQLAQSSMRRSITCCLRYLRATLRSQGHYCLPGILPRLSQALVEARRALDTHQWRHRESPWLPTEVDSEHPQPTREEKAHPEVPTSRLCCLEVSMIWGLI